MTQEADDGAGQFSPLFPEDDIPAVLNAIKNACVGLLKKSEMEIENRITHRLWQRVKREKPFRDGPLHINFKAAISDSDAQTDTPEGEADLQVICFRGPDVYFAIEAKRLRFCYPSGRFESGSREYVEEGMMRFIAGQYAPRMQVGAMLGYVFDADIAAARVDISKTIKKRRDMLRLNQGTSLRRSAVLPSHAVDETVHSPDKRALILYHVLVPV